MCRLFLIGYMGAGKTTIGRILAKRRGLDFIDLDLFIESRYQKTIGQIFEEYGEARFREIESSVLKEVADFENVVISTGGGTPCFHNNMEFMNKQGITIYLKASPVILAGRLAEAKEKRPLIKNKTMDELSNFISENLDVREPVYNKAHIIFETKDYANRKEVEDDAVYLTGIIDNYLGVI
ncbi:shikimate kinase [Dysgonomonas sp. 216]|uniref:shikimate kinase n=1 Tax=Dysgonomonas sp. 216 TaxID=2302934 RepID=UPI0013D44AFA|nr:shikimate kinase [Dysgonomonas sp. 216]NDW17539.1 shikimate kinase [Dysgonomonas sp. 216]